jgi:hypothetical protein
MGEDVGAFGGNVRLCVILALMMLCVMGLPGSSFGHDNGNEQPAKTDPAQNPAKIDRAASAASQMSGVSTFDATSPEFGDVFAHLTGLELPVDEYPKPANSSELTNVLEAEQTPGTGAPHNSQSQEPRRRALTAPLDGVFPGSDYLGPTPLIGVPDTDPVYPLTRAIWSIAPRLKDLRVKVFGWINPGISVSTSNKSNIPESYAIVPNRLELDQAVLRVERLPDTVQTDHVDWGFRLTPMYGIDYRWTTSQGWFSGQLLNHNRLYGFDPGGSVCAAVHPSHCQRNGHQGWAIYFPAGH